MKKNSIDMLIDGYTARHKRNLKLHVLTQSCTQSLDDFINNPKVKALPLKEEIVNNNEKDKDNRFDALLNKMATRKRKYNSGILISSQPFDDFTNNPEVEKLRLKGEIKNDEKE